MSVVRYIAWRFMLKGTEKGTFSSMTLFAWLAIGVGIGAMSSLLSVMYGFESALKERVLKASPHIMVKSKGGEHLKAYHSWTERFSKLPGVARVVPYLESEMIVQSDRRALGAVVWGIPAGEFDPLKKEMSAGSVPTLDSRIPQIVVGSELALRLGLSVGDTVKILSPTEKAGPMGLVPRSQAFEVAGLYTSGHYDFDQQYLFLILEDAQDLLRVNGAISGWHLWGARLEDTDRIEKELKPLLTEGLEAQTWAVFNSALFQSLKLEQYSMFTILSFAILIAVMNIVITLVMHVTHKRINIGVLRALGASRDQIRQIFTWQGAFLGGVGLFLGAILTVIILGYLKYFSSYQLPDIYYDRSIPIEVRPLSLALIYGVAILLIYAATFYPSQKAAKLNPIEAIRE